MKQRKIKSVDISGLDISLPHIHAKDGACNSIVNMRYNSGTWSNMCSWSSITTISSDTTYKIIYRHPALDEGDYIARSSEKIDHVRVDSTSGEVTVITSLTEVDGQENITISHFGSILYITNSSNIDTVFVWYNNTYSSFDMDALTPIDYATVTTTYIYSDSSDDSGANGGTLVAECECDENGMLLTTTRHDNYHYGLMRSDDYTPGVSYMMIGYRLFDGTIVKCSKVYMLQSEAESYKDKNGLIRIKSDYNYKYYTELSAGKHTVAFTMPSWVVDSPLVTSVVLLANKVNDIYDFENIHTNFSNASTIDIGDNWSTTSRSAIISEEAESTIYSPYYIMEEIEATEDNRYTNITLKYNDHFKSLYYNEVYEPNFSIHSTSYATKLDYNNRLHCGNITETFYSGASPLYSQSTFNDGTNSYTKTTMSYNSIYIETKISTDDDEVIVQKSVSDSVCYTYNSEQYVIVPNLLVYPDSRATEMTIYYKSSTGAYYEIYSTSLQSAPGVNLSWSIDFTYNSLLFHTPIKLTTTDSFTPTTVNDTTVTSDKVIVSESGNPFVFQPAQSYYLSEGGSVLRLATSSQQLTESRYGQHPLIVFSSEGIYAFEQGSDDTLYLSTVLISRDVLNSDSDVVSAEPYIFYCNNIAVMAISGSNIINISSPITAAASDSSSTDITEYINGAYMLFSTLYGELYIYNSNYTYGYCFNINAKKWSMREMDGWKMNDTMIATESCIYDLCQKEDSLDPLVCSLSTMAIKLEANRYKHLDAILAAIDSHSATIWDIELYGSNDLSGWYLLRNSTMNRHMRRFASSWRYFKLVIDVSGYSPESGIGNYFTISGADFEYYNRFYSHLRGDS